VDWRDEARELGGSGRTYRGEGRMRIRAPTTAHMPPTVLPVPPRDRARHRSRNHMMSEMSSGGQAGGELVAGNLLGESLKVLMPPEPRPCPAGT
jgi:hypothetical protein